jgi:hypothetical protein
MRFGLCKQHQRWPVIAVLIPVVGLVLNEAWSRYSAQESIKIEGLDELQQSVDRQFDELRRFLEEHHGRAGGVDALPTLAKGFEERYPDGFALYFKEGSRTVYWSSKSEGLVFDPSAVEIVSMERDKACAVVPVPRRESASEPNKPTLCIVGPGSISVQIEREPYRLSFEKIAASDEMFSWGVGVIRQDPWIPSEAPSEKR